MKERGVTSRDGVELTEKGAAHSEFSYHHHGAGHTDTIQSYEVWVLQSVHEVHLAYEILHSSGDTHNILPEYLHCYWCLGKGRDISVGAM